MHVVRVTCWDITQAVGVVSKINVEPTEFYLIVVKPSPGI